MASKSTKTKIVSPKFIKSTQQSRLRTRKTSTPKKRRGVSESTLYSGNTLSIHHDLNQISTDESEKRVSGSNLPWHVPFVESISSIKNETIEDDGIKQLARKQCDDSFVTPKIENVQDFIIDEWFEIGPSMHKDGHSPCPSLDNSVDVKYFPDTLKETLNKKVSEPPHFDLNVNEGNELLKSNKSDKAKDKHCSWESVKNDSPSLSKYCLHSSSADNFQNNFDEQKLMLSSECFLTDVAQPNGHNCSNILLKFNTGVTQSFHHFNLSKASLKSNKILFKKPEYPEGQNIVCLSHSPQFIGDTSQIQTIDKHCSEIISQTLRRKPEDNVSLLKEMNCTGVLATKLESGDFIDPDKTNMCRRTVDKLKVSQNSDQINNPKVLKGNNVINPLKQDHAKTKKKYRRRQESSAINNVMCPTCGKYFRGKYHLRRHEMSHTETRPFVCELCNKCFKQKVHLNGHMTVHKRCKNNYSDNKTNNVLQTSKCPGRPRKIYTENELSCKKCGKYFKTVYRLKRHEQSHTDIRPFTCKICGKGFKQTGHRNEHEANHEKSNKKRFLCNMCGVVFRCRSSFNNHLRSHNTERVRLMHTWTGVKQDCLEITHTGYDCPYCTEKFATAQALNSHLETHVEVKHRCHVQPYSCDVCKRTFTYRHNLIKHKLIHKAPEKYALFHKEKIEAHMASGKPSFRCLVCAKVFIRKETLAKHFKIHSGKKPFKCSICCREFTQNVHLKVHMRKHTGSRPFQCKECNRGFIDSTALAKHIENEACKSENALYKCKLCDKRHYYLGSIKQHIRKHHNVLSEENIEQYIWKFERLNRRKYLGDVDQLTCKICNKNFTEKCNLVRHVRNKHSDLMELLTADKHSAQHLVDLKYLQVEKNELRLVPSQIFLKQVNEDLPREPAADESNIEVSTATAYQHFKTGINGTRYSQNISGTTSTTSNNIGIENKTVSGDNCRYKLLEGFNTAEFDNLDYTDGHTQHSSCLFRSEYLDETVLNEIEKDGHKYNKDTSPQSDINFLYNIGLIVSSKAQKYKGEQVGQVGYQQDINTDDQTDNIIKSVSTKDTDEKDNIDVISKNDDSFFPLDNRSVEINHSENFFLNQNFINTEFKSFALAANKSFSMVQSECCMTSDGLCRKSSLNPSPDNLTCSDETNMSQANDKTIVENDPATSTTVNIEMVTDQHSQILESETFLSNGGPSVSTIAKNLHMETELSKELPHISSILPKQLLQFQSTENEYECFPTESQLKKCLGLFVCRDSIEVVSNVYPLHSLYSTFKPWLQDLICSSKPKRSKESAECGSYMKKTDENIG
ncbi:hypothetical protein Btru_063831 [Bulinus truncatus]|nr:hypothetical protein Btru_063831 [Bulinus truncatus]